MSNGIRYATRNLDHTAERISTILDKKYRAEWGVDHTYTLICDDEDQHHLYERHTDRVIGLTPLHYSAQSFASIGLDHQILICDHAGHLLSTLIGHTDRILGIIELSDQWLLSASLDRTLRIWRIQDGIELTRITAQINNISDITLFDDSRYFSVHETQSVTIWNYAGQQVALITGLTTHIQSVLQLGNDNWLVKAVGRNPGIWDQTGQFIAEFPFAFDFSHDIFELSIDKYFIRESKNTLSLWDSEGYCLGKHEPNNTLIELFNNLNSETRHVNEYMISHPDIINFPHIRNPLCSQNSVFTPRQDCAQLPDDRITSENRLLWNFFHRPLFGPIKTALKETVSLSRGSLIQLKHLHQNTTTEQQFHLQKRRRHAKWGRYWLIPFLLGCLLTLSTFADITWVVNLIDGLFIEPNHEGNRVDRTLLATLISSLFTIFTFIMSLKCFKISRKHKKRQQQKQTNLEIISLFPPAFEQLISIIKLYRRRLLKTIPIVQDNTLFTGEPVKQAMQHILHNDLENIALTECGLNRADVISSDQHAIVLNDWALIQDHSKREQAASKLQAANTHSFWSATGEILFAVQYIQYLFLTKDKIDIFTTFFDFISGECIGKEANAFYYKDVTNIATREVERTEDDLLQAASLSATEITLSIASGEKMRLTILNKNSIAQLIERVQNSSQHPIPPRLNRLIHNRDALTENPAVSDAERQDELELLNAEITDLKHQTIEQDVTRTHTKANEAIQNIRAQLKQHKHYDQPEDATT